MTTEQLYAIAVPLDTEHAMLASDVRSARERARKAEPGERVDIVRYETLSSQLEAWAHSCANASAQAGAVLCFRLPTGSEVAGLHQAVDGDVPDWVPGAKRQAVAATLSNGGALVTVRLPLETGQTSVGDMRTPPPPPAAVWKAPSGVRGAQAVEKRFADQLEEAIGDPEHPRPFVPSGVSNVVLTNTLREFVGRGGARIDVPAEYKDGSRAKHLFPLRSLSLLSSPRGPFDLTVRFALLSIRHTEMDAVVDGAWLRNVQISQQRAAAETDDLVYQISREQLMELTRGRKRVMMEMYQTGLQPAVVGFYRALVDHLLEHPGSVTVRPMYHQEPRRQPPERGPRGNRNQKGPQRGQQRGQKGGQQQRPGEETVETTSARFQPGKEWATAPRGDRR
jgi:hypothetical protein